MREEKQNFLQGAMILTAAGFIVKLLGAVYRIPLAMIIKDEGMGIYQMAYPVYVTLLSISTTGLPTAISKIVSEKRALNKYRGALRVFHISLSVLAAIGFVFTLLLILSANFLANRIIGNSKAVYPLVSIAPAIFFVSVMSAFRGFFQGMQVMTPSAVSQVVEQLGRVVTVFILAVILLPKGIEYAAAGAAFGPVSGGILGLLVLLVIYFRKKSSIYQEIKQSRRESLENPISIIYRLFAFAIPITLGGLIIPVMNLADAAIVNRRLQVAGFTVKRAAELYGQLTGLAAPLINFPPVLTIALAASLVPAISEAMAQKRYDLVSSRTTTGIRITLIFGLPAAVGLHLLATPIMEMLYGNPEAGISLSVLSFGVIFLTLNQTSAGILQGTGRTLIPVKNLLFGAVVKVLLNYILTAIPEINIRGAALGTVAAYMVSSLLNILAVYRLIGFKFDVKQLLLKPIIASASMGVAVVFTYSKILEVTGSSNLSTLAAIGVGVIVYMLMLLSIGGIYEKDLKLIPVIGSKAAGLFKKIGLLRG